MYSVELPWRMIGIISAPQTSPLARKMLVFALILNSPRPQQTAQEYSFRLSLTLEKTAMNCSKT